MVLFDVDEQVDNHTIYMFYNRLSCWFFETVYFIDMTYVNVGALFVRFIYFS